MSGPLGSSQWMYNADTSYSIDYSCRIPEDGKFTRTPGSAGNRRTWTWSAWMKNTFAENINRAEWLFAYDTGATNWYDTAFTASMGLANTGIRIDEASSASQVLNLKSPALTRDHSAWRHIVIIFDSTQGTNTNRLRVHVNGVQLGDWFEITWTSQNFDSQINNAMPHTLGKGGNGDSYGFAGYIAEVHHIDGTAVEPTSFGEFGDYGEWKPKEYDTADGAYGTCGYYLDFSDSAALGDDAAGSNDWSATNIAAIDQTPDTPTNNFCNLNELQKYVRSTYPKEGGLKFICGSTETSAPHGMPGSMAAPNSGKWYWEVAIGDGLNSKYARIGAADLDQDLVRDITRGINSASLPWIYAGAWGIDCQNGTKLSSAGAESYGSGMSDGANIVGIALDRDNGKIWFADNNTWIASGDPAAGTNFAFDSVTTGHIVPYVNTQDGAAGFVTCNFGQDSSFAGLKTAQGNSDGGGIGDFYYTPPTGFKALCTKNLPDVAVIPSEHFNTVLYTGTGSSNAITGVGFQPEMTWISERDESEAVASVDILRGSGVTEINISATSAEADDAQKVTAIGSDGFTVGTSFAANHTDHAHVSYHWKAGGTGVANTTGSNNSTVSANVDAGFSIVTYTGSGGPDTVGHGLSQAPEMVVTKNRTTSGNEWWMYHKENTSAPETEYIRWDSDGATADYLSWNDTAPTSTVFTVGDYRPNNGAWGDSYVAYCWHSVEGYSKVGRLIGSSLANGPFVYLGFRPMFVFMKNTQANREPVIYDSKRDPTNPMNEAMSTRGYAETASYGAIDFYSNGFKIRENNYHINEDDRTILYLAFAETPFKYSNAR